MAATVTAATVDDVVGDTTGVAGATTCIEAAGVTTACSQIANSEKNLKESC
jgi:hypothetical protein